VSSMATHRVLAGLRKGAAEVVTACEPMQTTPWHKIKRRPTWLTEDRSIQGPERPSTGGWSLLAVMSDLQHGVD
jgi:hypothetical protein